MILFFLNTIQLMQNLEPENKKFPFQNINPALPPEKKKNNPLLPSNYKLINKHDLMEFCAGPILVCIPKQVDVSHCCYFEHNALLLLESSDFPNQVVDFGITRIKYDTWDSKENLLEKYKDISDFKITEVTETEQYKLTNDKPVHCKPYRISPPRQEAIKQKIQEILFYVAPFLVVPKKDGSIRMVTDFRKLNNFTPYQNNSLPRAEYILQVLEHTKYTSSLDIIFYDL
ncbi:hypothetical protein PR048_000707, partial [Dryococelus australis]